MTLASTPRCTVFRVRGTLKGKWVLVMLDSGATLNFINSSLVSQRGLCMEAHEGFKVKVAGGNLLSCTHLVPQLSITMGNHTVTNDFFVVDLDDMEVILDIQWMETLNEYTKFQEDGVLLQSGWQKGSVEGDVKWRPKGNLDTRDGGNLQT